MDSGPSSQPGGQWGREEGCGSACWRASGLEREEGGGRREVGGGRREEGGGRRRRREEEVEEGGGMEV